MSEEALLGVAEKGFFHWPSLPLPLLGQRMTEVLEVIKELGGMKKFKDLAEAMSATSTDDIPF
jgi:hypothetical protein